MFNSSLSFWLRLGVSVGLIAWLVWLADAEKVLDSLHGVSLPHLVAIALVVNGDRFLMAYKWNWLLRAKGMHLAFWKVVQIYYKATFLGVVLPAIGTDAARVYDTYRKIGRMNDVIASVATERILGLLASSGICLVGAAILPFYVGLSDLTVPIVVGGIALLLFSFSALVVQGRWIDALASTMSRLNWLIVHRATKLLRSYQSYLSYRTVLLWFSILTIVEQFLGVAVTFIVSEAFGLNIPIVACFLFVPIASVLSRLPISYEGFGIREVLFVYLFQLVGVTPADALLVGLAGGMLTKFAYAPLAAYWWLTDRSPVRPQCAVDSASIRLNGIAPGPDRREQP